MATKFLRHGSITPESVQDPPLRMIVDYICNVCFMTPIGYSDVTRMDDFVWVSDLGNVSFFLNDDNILNC